MENVLVHQGDCQLLLCIDGNMDCISPMDGEYGQYSQVGTTDYEKLKNKPLINGNELIGDKTGAELGLISEADLSDELAKRGITSSRVKFDTTENWSSKTGLVSEKDMIYVYTDYKTVDGQYVAGFKVGDGLAYVVDLPFVDEIYARHINDEVRHITQAEREFWNNKNRAYISLTDPENLILTKL